MANLNISSALSSAIEGVLNTSSITEFTLDIQITNVENVIYSYTPPWIDALSITQSFAENFADRLILDMTMAPADYMALYNNAKGLQVSLRLVYFDSQTSQRVFNPPPIARTYKAMLIDPQDLSKKYTTGSLVPTPSMPLVEQHIATRIPAKLHLIETAAYTLRQQKFNGIYKTAKVADVMAHIVKGFNVGKVYLVPPDNTMAWDHIIIPPSQGIDQIFDYLQYAYGVYMKGIDWYYTNSTLYIYPAYENNPILPYNADIYNAPSGNYAGLHSYHQSDVSGMRLGIISTTDVNTTDISTHTAENQGTGFSFTRASSIIDKFVSNTKNGSFINNNISLTVGTTIDRTISQGANNTRHTKTTDNIFEESSKLAKSSAVLIKCGWQNAVPFLLYPGHNCKYHYDRNSSFTTQQGILERVVYTFTRQRRLSNGATYAGNASLALRATSDVTNAPALDFSHF